MLTIEIPEHNRQTLRNLSVNKKVTYDNRNHTTASERCCF